MRAFTAESLGDTKIANYRSCPNEIVLLTEVKGDIFGIVTNVRVNDVGDRFLSWRHYSTENEIHQPPNDVMIGLQAAIRLALDGCVESGVINKGKIIKKIGWNTGVLGS